MYKIFLVKAIMKTKPHTNNKIEKWKSILITFPDNYIFMLPSYLTMVVLKG